jgi:hypothetical protein
VQRASFLALGSNLNGTIVNVADSFVSMRGPSALVVLDGSGSAQVTLERVDAWCSAGQACLP